MKILALALFAFSLSAAHAESITCTAKVYKEGSEGKEDVREGKFLIDYDAGYAETSGDRVPFLQKESVELKNVPQFLKDLHACDLFGNDQKCSDNVIDKFIPAVGSELTRFTYLTVFFLELNKIAPAKERYTDIDIDTAKIVSAKAYALEAPNAFGIPGLFEYFDAEGKLLGRAIIRTPLVMQCK